MIVAVSGAQEPAALPAARDTVVRIEASRGWVSLRLAEVWQYRELLFFLVWRDVKVRYKQTVLGVAWAVLQPLISMVIFTLFFGRLAKMPSDGVPYSLFAFTGLVPWTFFSTGLSQASNSLIGSSHLITKVYFPRLIVPMAAVCAALVDLGLAFLLLVVMLLFHGLTPSATVMWLPAFVVLALVTALGVGLWLSALNVQFRDVRYVVPFLVQVWMFATPIVYPSSLLRDPWRTIYGINPMVGVVDGFRWALLDTGKAPGLTLVVSTVASILILVSGAFYFRRMERTFADLI